MARADWVVSSRVWTTQSITINASPQDVTAPSGGLYLLHSTSSLSLIARLLAALLAAGVTTPTVYITEDRHVRIAAGAVFSITWGSGTTLRDLLGFTGDISGMTAYTAPNRSTLLWSAGKVLTPERSPLGTVGEPVADVSATVGPGGRVVSRIEGDPDFLQTYSARHVPAERWWQSASGEDGVAGEWRHFWENEVLTAQRLIVLRRVNEGTSATASADYSLSTVLGPYRPDLTDRDLRRMRMRRASGFERVDAYYDIELPLIKTTEFS